MRFLKAALVLFLGMGSAQGQRNGINPNPHTGHVSSRPDHRSSPSVMSGGQKTVLAGRPKPGKGFFSARVGGRFVWIRPGTFMMGSTEETDPDRYSDEVPHRVTLTRGFWLLDREITRSGYARVMGASPPNPKWEDHPVELVSWEEAMRFCAKLTQTDRELGVIGADLAYRLPTEAEWEYSCRAGTTTAVYVDFGNRTRELDAIAWWAWNSSRQMHSVTQKLPNAWGLYDMVGNVWEWCADRYGTYPTGAVTDPTGPVWGANRVTRGGGWFSGASSSRAAKRRWYQPGSRSLDLGFRPALSTVR
jgi:sulfatase modifying factor 1